MFMISYTSAKFSEYHFYIKINLKIELGKLTGKHIMGKITRFVEETFKPREKCHCFTLAFPLPIPHIHYVQSVLQHIRSSMAL